MQFLYMRDTADARRLLRHCGDCAVEIVRGKMALRVVQPTPADEPTATATRAAYTDWLARSLASLLLSENGETEAAKRVWE